MTDSDSDGDAAGHRQPHNELGILGGRPSDAGGTDERSSLATVDERAAMAVGDRTSDELGAGGAVAHGGDDTGQPMEGGQGNRQRTTTDIHDKSNNRRGRR